MKKKLLTRITVAVSLLLGATVIFLYFSSCVTIPERAQVVTGTGAAVQGRFEGVCSDAGRGTMLVHNSSVRLNPASISLLSWNSHKGSHDAFGADLARLEQGIDLLLLQEAVIDETLKNRLQSSGRLWNMAIAFELEQTEIGLLSASGVAPASACADRVPEPLLVLPKTILATTYPLDGMSEELLVVNVHMVNFTFTSDALKEQLAKAARLVKNHPGPVIVAGDFNTWSDNRKSEVGAKMAELGLQQIHFSPDNRSRFFNQAVDEIYFRGLTPLRSVSHIVESSDHNPLEVHFTVAEEFFSSQALQIY